MDFDNNNTTEPSGPFNSPSQNNSTPKPRRKRSVWRVIWGIFTGLSVLANILLLLLLIGMGAMFAVGDKGFFAEEIIYDGPRTSRILVINVTGIINDETSREFSTQLKAARKDDSVKAVIVRVNSPGGAVSASDRIYNDILNYRDITGKPVVGFMRAIATSGGYYASVACDTIIAEPTTITGSIGVIFGHFVLRELLEEKLGIEPVIIKSGQRKDWPSPFATPDEEQIQYLNDKLITPAYERFVEIIAKSRPQLEPLRLKQLADGSIFGAAEALEENLIDEIGYLDQAIATAKLLAAIEQAQVIEYRKPFSFADILNSQSKSILKIDRDTLQELSTPELMYIWKPF